MQVLPVEVNLNLHRPDRSFYYWNPPEGHPDSTRSNAYELVVTWDPDTGFAVWQYRQNIEDYRWCVLESWEVV